MEVKSRNGSKVIYGNKETQAQTIARLEAEKQALQLATLDMASVLDAQAQQLASQEEALLEIANMLAGGIA